MLQKICSKCHQSKSTSDFYNKGKENRKNSYCKSCFNTYCMKRWTQKKIDAVSYKGGKCEKCGYHKSMNALEFHHVGKKEYSWNKLRLYGLEKIKKELDQCSLLCSNCHRERHEELNLE